VLVRWEGACAAVADCPPGFPDVILDGPSMALGEDKFTKKEMVALLSALPHCPRAFSGSEEKDVFRRKI